MRWWREGRETRKGRERGRRVALPVASTAKVLDTPPREILGWGFESARTFDLEGLATTPEIRRGNCKILRIVGYFLCASIVKMLRNLYETRTMSSFRLVDTTMFS